VDRRSFIGTLAAGLLAAPRAATAQPPGRVPRIGALGGPQSPGSPAWAGFRQGLRELGWEEGRNLVLEFRFAGARHEAGVADHVWSLEEIASLAT
jgi:putative ABC transport system substrate-binding protein